jgi:hypothetical protein
MPPGLSTVPIPEKNENEISQDPHNEGENEDANIASHKGVLAFRQDGLASIDKLSTATPRKFSPQQQQAAECRNPQVECNENPLQPVSPSPFGHSYSSSA